MAENLAYETPDSWYYQEDPKTGAAFGRLYTWEAAMMACPEGWRLPTYWETNYINTASGMVYHRGLLLCGTMGYNVLNGGFRDTLGVFQALTETNRYWNSTDDHLGIEKGDGKAWFYRIYDRGVHRSVADKREALSCRCVKD